MIKYINKRPHLRSSTSQGIVRSLWRRARLAFARYRTRQPHVSAVKIASEGSILYGVVHDPRSNAKRGILMVAAGAYRVGPHRQFLLLARDWAAGGIPVMRFDYQGQGDSEGAGAFNFDSLMHDIRSAIDCFTSAVPGIERVVLWGLCEAALNSLLYARRDPRVDGLVLVNPQIDVTEHIVGSIRPNLPGFIDRYLELLSAFKGKSLFILSERDNFAIDFQANVMRTNAWERLVEDLKVAALHLTNADHNFTRKELRGQVSIWTADWIRSLRAPF
jgi:uncharacterized protein